MHSPPPPPPPTTAAPPGWYVDPDGGSQRYWDGAGWTGHMAPPPQQAQSERAPAGDWIGGVLLSLLMPIVGLIAGIVYLARGGAKRDVGAVCVVLSIISFLVWASYIAHARAGY